MKAQQTKTPEVKEKGKTVYVDDKNLKNEEKKEEKKEPPPKPAAAPAGSLWKGVLWPSINYPESEDFSLWNTYVGRWSHKRTSIPNKIPKHADLCTEIIKRTFLKDKLVKEFFEGFDLG